MATAAGLHPHREVAVYNTGDRPADVLLPSWSSGRPLAVDVSVSHPQQAPTTTAARRGKTASALAVAARENAKIARYDSACRNAGADFLPLVCCAYGGWASSSQRFLKTLAHRLAAKARGTAALVHANTLRVLSATLWRENARVALGERGCIGAGAAAGWARAILDQVWNPWH